MRFRKLRIAWSVAWAVVAVLLIVLWVRSYWYKDRCHGPVSRFVASVASYDGQIALLFYEWQFNDFDWGVESESNTETESTIPGVFYRPEPSVLGVAWNFSGVSVVIVRDWLPVVLAVAAAVAPWIRCRFTLRTLFIATTLIAIVLGLIVAVV